MGSVARRAGWVVAVVVVGGYAWVALEGPQGLPALMEKHREIRQLEEQNAVLAHENEARSERIQRLETSTTEQEMEIRKQLKLLRPGETTFILPDQTKPDQTKSDQNKPEQAKPAKPQR